MQKILTVATEIQKTVFTQVLLAEIATGFWKNARPSDHADIWADVQVVVGSELGPNGFDLARKYNFVNPHFFIKAEEKLLAAAHTINPNLTSKQLKKQLISLNQILGARLKEIGGTVSKLPRGRKNPAGVGTLKVLKNTNVRKVPANIVEPENA